MYFECMHDLNIMLPIHKLEIKGQYNEVCPKLSLPCPNQCDFGSDPRKVM